VAKQFKIPVSVLVVIHTPDLQVLLLERADHPGYWQSVTGSQQEGETLRDTAIREVREETGLEAQAHRLTDWKTSNVYEIFPEWRWRYAPGVTRNTEHAFGLQLPEPLPIALAPREHVAYLWMPYDLAAQKVFSWSNAAMLRALPELVTNQGRA
jgi:dATP pyrophosphohydrolase